MNTTTLLFAMLVLLVLALVGVRRVPAQRVRTVRRNGRYRRTLGPGWHWMLPVLERRGVERTLIGNHLHVRHTGSNEEADLFYQIVEPHKTGEALDSVESLVAAQTREALSQADHSAEQLKNELNRRIGHLGLRVVRCSLHLA